MKLIFLRFFLIVLGFFWGISSFLLSLAIGMSGHEPSFLTKYTLFWPAWSLESFNHFLIKVGLVSLANPTIFWPMLIGFFGSITLLLLLEIVRFFWKRLVK